MSDILTPQRCEHAAAMHEIAAVNNRMSVELVKLRSSLAVLAPIAELMRTQDNLATAHPVFVVQQRRRDYGYDTQFSDGGEIAWISDGLEADAEEFKLLEAAFENTSEDSIDGWQRTAYVDRWEFVTACFTQKGAEAYIKLNGHNLKEPRVYVDSAYRNAEWQTVAAFLIAIEEAE